MQSLTAFGMCSSKALEVVGDLFGGISYMRQRMKGNLSLPLGCV